MRSRFGCKSIIFNRRKGICQLGDSKAAENCSNMVESPSPAWAFYQEPPPCGRGEEMGPMGLCVCAQGFTGVPCTRYLHDCHDWFEYRGKKEGVFTVTPLKAAAGFKVYCKRYTSSRTYIMDRRRRTVSFTQSWQQYLDGFGSFDGDYWLGLDKIYALTDDRDQELRVGIKVMNNSNYVLNYYNFRISDAASGYRLFFNESLLNITRDCLKPLIGSKFSAYNHDKDGNSSVNCAQKRGGGFWFNANKGCSACNPTGVLYQPPNGKRLRRANETFWTGLLGDTALFKVSMYLIRMPEKSARLGI